MMADWLTPEVMRTLAVSLLHFLWQGAAIAAAAAALLAVVRKPATRYLVGMGALACMLASIGLTFALLLDRDAGRPAVRATPAPAVAAAPLDGMAPANRFAPVRASSLPALNLLWIVRGWLGGVAFFALRIAMGLLLLEHLRRRSLVALPAALVEQCRALERRLGIRRAIRYAECRLLSVPAVIGLVRPVVLLPLRALTGLTAEQLEAVIAHELAHIRRFDALVNFFQVLAETLLFYHPAVWWLNKRIRAERENCCDDVAVATCGSTVDYARALTAMEEWRAVPSFAMAATGSPLAARITRLLGLDRQGRSSAGILTASLVLTAALVAGTVSIGIAHPAAARAAGASLGRLALDEAATPQEPPAKPASPNQPAPLRAPVPAPAARPESSGESYLEGMKSAGLRDLDVDQLIALKIQGVTPEYVREIKALGLEADADALVGMKIQGVTPEYVKEIRALGLHPDADELVGMKIQGVTPEYVKGMRDLGIHPDADELVGMKIQGVTPEYVRAVREAGFTPDGDQLMSMRIQGVTPEFAKEIKDLGLKADLDDLISMKIQGVTPEYIKEVRSSGLHADVDQLVSMKIQGVSPEYRKALEAAGYKLDAEDLVQAKIMGITPEFIEKARSHGFKDLTIDKLIQLKHAGIF